MNLRKLLCALIALVLMVSSAAVLAEGDADQRIAELEAQVAELTEQLEQAQLAVAAYENEKYLVLFDGGYVTVEEAQAQYDYISSMYESYGYSLSGYEDYFRQEIMYMLGEQALLKVIGAEMGLDQLDAQELAGYESEALETYESYIAMYESYFAGEDMTDEEVRAATEDYLQSTGYTYESMLQSLIDTHVSNALYAYATAGVEMGEEDLQATYEAAVEGDEQTYASDAYSYEYARVNGESIAWNPEGYRTVKHILLKFDSEQAAAYSELTATITDLEGQISAAEQADEDAEAVDAADLQAQLDEANAAIDALYAQLDERVDEVMNRLNGGEDFDAVMAEFGEDPGMQAEPAMTDGYYVSDFSQLWEAAFTRGAMSIAAIGGISEPVRGTNGIHIIYYASDVPAGAIDIDDIREELEEAALAEKINTTYYAQVDAWMEERNVEYHLDRFK